MSTNGQPAPGSLHPIFPYVWFWRQSEHRVFDRDRKGERCRVVVRGSMNSALIEFEDGYWTITSRNGLRRA